MSTREHPNRIHARRVVQREVVFRARRAIFARVEAPTAAADAMQARFDAQATAAVLARFRGVPALRSVLSGLPIDERRYWYRRAARLVAFGVRSYANLAAISPSYAHRPRLELAAATLQLAASFLDWIGDETGAAGQVAGALPPADLRAACVSRVARDAVMKRSASAEPAVRDVITLVCVTLDLAEDRSIDASAFHAALCDAYEAELTSFRAQAGRTVSPAVAWRKAVAVTAAVGELSKLSVPPADRAAIGRAAALVAAVVARTDDIADLVADAHTGALNSIIAAPVADEVAGARSVIERGTIETCATAIADDMLALDQLMHASGTCSQHRENTMEWLRTIVWSWLS